jgi:hypothetical protein
VKTTQAVLYGVLAVAGSVVFLASIFDLVYRPFDPQDVGYLISGAAAAGFGWWGVARD